MAWFVLRHLLLLVGFVYYTRWGEEIMGFFDNLFGNTQDYARKEEQRELARQEREQAIKDAQKNEPIFQVGTTEDGRVTLRVGQYTNWVTMTDAGVDQLIAMLQAAKSLVDGDTIIEEEEC